MLRPMPIKPIPPETARIARAAYLTGNRYLRLADELDELFTDGAFQALFPAHGQPALPPWRLALVTLLQFAEGISDRLKLLKRQSYGRASFALVQQRVFQVA